MSISALSIPSIEWRALYVGLYGRDFAQGCVGIIEALRVNLLAYRKSWTAMWLISADVCFSWLMRYRPSLTRYHPSLQWPNASISTPVAVSRTESPWRWLKMLRRPGSWNLATQSLNPRLEIQVNGSTFHDVNLAIPDYYCMIMENTPICQSPICQACFKMADVSKNVCKFSIYLVNLFHFAAFHL